MSSDAHLDYDDGNACLARCHLRR